jgi:aryl-alcohol dehydrogenase-like predicted oxidoreductase
MATRVRFGSTGLSVSPVCFGTWQLSPRFWGAQSKAEILQAMRAGLDAGINFFDTADAYGDGLAETVLGEFLATVSREDVVVCTKVFNHFNPDGSRYPDLSAEHLRQRCEIELARLGIDTIDIYLLHLVDVLTSMRDVTATLEALRAEGKIRHYGVSNHPPEHLRALRRWGRYEVCQPPYSLLDAAIEKDLLPYCEAEDIGVMVYSPLHKGLLGGKYKGTETFADFRQHHPDFQGERFREITAAVQSLRPLADSYGLSIYQLVLAATLMHPAIQVAVVGIKTPAQIVEAAGAMGRVISREDYFRVRKALTIEGAGRIRDATGKAK